MMKVKINRNMLTQTRWDSGLLTPLASVLHTFKEPGRYQCTVLRETESVALFELLADAESAETQVDIDLDEIYQRRYTPSGRGDPFVVNPGQPTQFYVPRGRGGYAVVVYKSGPRQEAVEFDSRELRDGDVFILTLIRSGTYSLTSERTAKGEIHVQKRKGRSVPTEPAMVTCEHTGFTPDNIKTEFSQPLFFVIKTPARIRVQLEKQPDSNRRSES